MARARTAPVKNQYKQQRVTAPVVVEEKRVKTKPHPSFSEGDMVTLSKRFNVPTVTIPVPCKAISIDESALCFSGWSVAVQDIKGIVHNIDSEFFSPVTPAQ